MTGGGAHTAAGRREADLRGRRRDVHRSAVKSPVHQGRGAVPAIT